jgi:acyl dehydratase
MLKSRERLYLEDLPVGRHFVSAPITIDEEQIVRFAREFDPQPFHLSDEGAQDSLFGSLAASGWHTAALTMRLCAETIPIANGNIGAGVEINWPRPTRPGDTLKLFSEVVEITQLKSKPDRAIVTFRNETRNQDGEVVQHMTAKLFVFKRPEEG